MNNWQEFLVAMAAFSTAAQKLTEQLVKGRLVNQLDTTKADPVQESRRQLWIHLICAAFGALLFIATRIDPIQALRGNPISFTDEAWNHAGDCLITAVLVTFGGSFFNELLGAVQAFKDAQSQLTQQLSVQTTASVVAAMPGGPVANYSGSAPPFRDVDAEGYDIGYFDVDADGNPGVASEVANV